MTERRSPWRKSTYSNGSSSCIETATRPGAVALRDSKDPAGPQLVIPTASWRILTGQLQKLIYGPGYLSGLSLGGQRTRSTIGSSSET